MNYPELISRSVEISKALVNTNVGLHSSDLEVTRSVGDLARFAITLRSVKEIDDKQLNLISIAMKIDTRLVKGPILDYMHKELGWVIPDYDAQKIKSIRVNIPPIEDVITVLGEKWNKDNPTTIDYGSVRALSILAERPYTNDALKSELNVNDDDYISLVGYGCTASVLGNIQIARNKSRVYMDSLLLDSQSG